jgi:predicted AAA+ superfamily ATPase
LAWQVGSEVIYAELAEVCELDTKTISNYIDILEKAYVVFRRPSFSRNLRNEIKKGWKIYFYDNGIRNAAIGQFQPLSLRSDTGALWENFLISKRRKQLIYRHSTAGQYFWRTMQQQEIDYVEEKDSKLIAFEMKWNPRETVRFPLTFTQTYQAEGQVITRSNYRDFFRA